MKWKKMKDKIPARTKEVILLHQPYAREPYFSVVGLVGGTGMLTAKDRFAQKNMDPAVFWTEAPGERDLIAYYNKKRVKPNLDYYVLPVAGMGRICRYDPNQGMFVTKEGKPVHKPFGWAEIPDIPQEVELRAERQAEEQQRQIKREIANYLIKKENEMFSRTEK